MNGALFLDYVRLLADITLKTFVSHNYIFILIHINMIHINKAITYKLFISNCFLT